MSSADSIREARLETIRYRAAATQQERGWYSPDVSFLLGERDALVGEVAAKDDQILNWQQAAYSLEGKLDKAEREVAALRKIEKAARELHHFLWEEKETKEPPSALLDQGYVALESSADCDREEQLVEALGEALAGRGDTPPAERKHQALGVCWCGAAHSMDEAVALNGGDTPPAEDEPYESFAASQCAIFDGLVSPPARSSEEGT